MLLLKTIDLPEKLSGMWLTVSSYLYAHGYFWEYLDS